MTVNYAIFYEPDKNNPMDIDIFANYLPKKKKTKSITFKHGKHDQKTHGRRGKRGGSGGKARPSASQSVDKIAQSIFDEQKKQLDSMTNLSPEQRRVLEAQLQIASRHAAETEILRRERLYDADGNYIATPEQREAFHVELQQRAKEIRRNLLEVQKQKTDVHEELYRVFGTTNGTIPKALFDDSDEESIRNTLSWNRVNPAIHDEVVRVLLADIEQRGAIELVSRTYLRQPKPATLSISTDKDSGLDTSVLKQTVAPFTHIASVDKQRVNVSMELLDSGGGMYSSAGVPTNGVVYNSNSIYIDGNLQPSLHAEVLAHEYGHHLEQHKINAPRMAEQFMDSLASNNPDYRLVVQQLDTAAQKQGLAGTYIPINSFLVPERYMLQMYRQERNGTRETQTEVLSSAIEKGLALPLVPTLDKSDYRVQVKYPQRGAKDDSLLFLSDTILNYTQVWTYMYATLHY